TSELSPERATWTSNVVDDAPRNTSLDKSLVQFQSSERSLTSRLEDHRITRNQSASNHRRRYRQWKVEWRNNRPGTVRSQDAFTVLTRDNALHRPDIPLILLHQARVVVQEVYGFIGLGDCLVPVLRNLVRHERSEMELAFL